MPIATTGNVREAFIQQLSDTKGKLEIKNGAEFTFNINNKRYKFTFDFNRGGNRTKVTNVTVSRVHGEGTTLSMRQRLSMQLCDFFGLSVNKKLERSLNQKWARHLLSDHIKREVQSHPADPVSGYKSSRTDLTVQLATFWKLRSSIQNMSR